MVSSHKSDRNETKEIIVGDRASIAIKFTAEDTIYLYTHWLGSEVEEIVNEAIEEGRRLDDAPYFTRILFSKMIARGHEGLEGETGFGIAPYVLDHDYGNPFITVDFTDVRNGVPQVSYEMEVV